MVHSNLVKTSLGLLHVRFVRRCVLFIMDATRIAAATYKNNINLTFSLSGRGLLFELGSYVYKMVRYVVFVSCFNNGMGEYLINDFVLLNCKYLITEHVFFFGLDNIFNCVYVFSCRLTRFWCNDIMLS